MKKTKETLFIVWAPEEWHDYVRRPHWSALSRKRELLIIEPPVGLTASCLHINRLISFLKYGTAIRKDETGIYFIRPFSLFTYGICYRFSMLAKLDRLVIRRGLKRTIKSLRNRYKITVVCITKNQQFYISDIMKTDLVCYFITDDYYVRPSDEAVNKESKIFKRAKESEKVIKRFADIVFVSSRRLLRSREDLFENIHYIPNAVDFDHFAQAQKVQLEVPQELRKIPGIKIGFVGRINELLDLNLMSALAAHDRKWTIILIGSVNAKRRYRKSKDFLKIKSMPNVYFMGHRPYEQLPAFLKGIDVCVLPFRKSTWMESSCPNKIFQYLAAGKPIVSTNFPASAELNNVIEVSGEISDFIKKIEICLLEENEQKRKIRIEVARKFSVSRHADLIIYEIEKSLSKN